MPSGDVAHATCVDAGNSVKDAGSLVEHSPYQTHCCSHIHSHTHTECIHVSGEPPRPKGSAMFTGGLSCRCCLLKLPVYEKLEDCVEDMQTMQTSAQHLLSVRHACAGICHKAIVGITPGKPPEQGWSSSRFNANLLRPVFYVPGCSIHFVSHHCTNMVHESKSTVRAMPRNLAFCSCTAPLARRENAGGSDQKV